MANSPFPSPLFSPFEALPTGLKNSFQGTVLGSQKTLIWETSYSGKLKSLLFINYINNINNGNNDILAGIRLNGFRLDDVGAISSYATDELSITNGPGPNRPEVIFDIATPGLIKIFADNSLILIPSFFNIQTILLETPTDGVIIP